MFVDMYVSICVYSRCVFSIWNKLAEIDVYHNEGGSCERAGAAYAL